MKLLIMKEKERKTMWTEDNREQVETIGAQSDSYTWHFKK